jgi:hypothetical protein
MEVRTTVVLEIIPILNLVEVKDQVDADDRDYDWRYN